MKKIFLFLFVMMMFNQFSHAEVKTAQQPKCLVLYYSYSGVTKSLAEYIAEDCGGTLLEVVDHGNYPRPESQTTYTYANNERSQIDNGVWPEINTTVDSFDEWDAVFICTPLWNGKMANPMLTFLHNHAAKLGNKQVALAVTSWSSGISNVVVDAHNTLPDCTFLGNPLHVNYNGRSRMAEMASEWVETILPEIEIPKNNRMRVIVGGKTFLATIDDSATGEAFMNLLPMTIDMTELNGNEKYYYLSNNLPQNASNPGTIHAGDIMLYGSSCVVLFYKTFNTSYSYTRIAWMDDPTGLAEAVGSGRATVTFELFKEDLIIGDVNGDGEVTIGDVTDLINLILSGNESLNTAADVNADGELSIGDVTALINIFLSK